MFEGLSFLPHEFIQLNRDQWLPKEQLEELQWNRLKMLLRHAYENTAFYRERFEEAGIIPEDIREKKDLEKIPFTTREDLRRPEPLIAQGFVKNKLKSSTTSGSSGRRTTTYFDKRAWLKGKILLKLRARIACGLRPWCKIAVFSEVKAFNSFIKAVFLRQKAFSILDSIENHLSEIELFQPSAMYGFPSYFSLLADSDIKVNPSRIFTSSEMLDLKTKRKIESVFKTEVFDVYGCTEVKEISWECPEHDGYHINNDWLLVEFIKNGKATTKEDSSIVVTALYNYGMPLIRYKVGDTGRLLERKCPCGRGLPLMTPSQGRSVDYFMLPDNSTVSPYAMTCAIENIKGMRQYQIKQEEKELITVNVVPDNQFNRDMKNQIKFALEKILPGVTVQIKTVEKIERERSGKYRIVISEVQK
ncbi:MAG: phenylacetate--CoA ligase family protein [Candidatus Scalinduaceae bacterium]